MLQTTPGRLARFRGCAGIRLFEVLTHFVCVVSLRFVGVVDDGCCWKILPSRSLWISSPRLLQVERSRAS